VILEITTIHNFLTQSTTLVIITNQVRIYKTRYIRVCSGNKMIVLTTIQDVMIKLIHNIIYHDHHWPGTHRIQLNNQEEGYTDKLS
jgi:hypothetical protein